jgi:hypothetical protein
LYAALDVKTGKVHGKTAARHTSEEFVDFLGQVVGLCKPRQEIHIVVDNLSAHKTAKVQEFLLGMTAPPGWRDRGGLQRGNKISVEIPWQVSCTHRELSTKARSGA